MSLDHTIGEIIEGMDSVYRIVPVSKYQEQTRLTTLVKRMTEKVFRREIDVEMPIFQAAWEHAQQAFANSGVPAGNRPIDILAQEYPRTNVVCFVFSAEVFGREMLVTAPFKLTEEQIADLKLRDLWQSQELVMH